MERATPPVCPALRLFSSGYRPPSADRLAEARRKPVNGALHSLQIHPRGSPFVTVAGANCLRNVRRSKKVSKVSKLSQIRCVHPHERRDTLDAVDNPSKQPGRACCPPDASLPVFSEDHSQDVRASASVVRGRSRCARQPKLRFSGNCIRLRTFLCGLRKADFVCPTLACHRACRPCA